MKKGSWRKKYVGAVLTNLSKAFDCLNHELWIAKLEAYGFETEALSFIYDYLSKRNQRTKINSSYSSWIEKNLVSHKDQYLVHCFLISL